MGKNVVRKIMRAVYYKRNFVSYMCLVGVFSVLLTLYVWGLKQHKQTGVKFNLKNPKFKRDTSITRNNAEEVRFDPRFRKPPVRGNLKGLSNPHKVKENQHMGQEGFGDPRAGTGSEGRAAQARPQEWDDILRHEVVNVKDRQALAPGAGKEGLNVYVVEEHHEGAYTHVLI